MYEESFVDRRSLSWCLYQLILLVVLIWVLLRIVQLQVIHFFRKKGVGNSPLERAFNNQCREQLDSLIVRTFYSVDFLFHFAKNPYWIKMIKFAANNNLASYIPPSYNKLKTTLSQKERAHIEKLLRSIKDIWKEKGLRIVSDGWTNVQKSHLSIL